MLLQESGILMWMGMLINLLVSGIAVFVSAYVLPGVHVDSFVTAIVVAVFLGIVNMILKPIILLLTLPINLLTLGLFTFVINAVLVLLVANFVPGFSVLSFWWALVFSLVLSIVNGFLHQIVSAK